MTYDTPVVSQNHLTCDVDSINTRVCIVGKSFLCTIVQKAVSLVVKTCYGFIELCPQIIKHLERRRRRKRRRRRRRRRRTKKRRRRRKRRRTRRRRKGEN